MYVENKDGTLNGASAWIGWVQFSKTGRTVYYKGRTLKAIGGRGVRGNFLDEETLEEYWVSGVRVRGSNAHTTSISTTAVIDEDARDEYERIKRVRPSV